MVCGPSDSGKSKLIRRTNRLDPIQEEEIIVDNVSVHDKKTNMTKIRAVIGFVFQQFNLYPHMTALQDVTLASRKVRKVKKEEAERLGKEILAKVGLGDRVNSCPAQLSGGQQQRVAVEKGTSYIPPLCSWALRCSSFSTTP
ncbi:MAG: amino acid ABC transporter ATP-binding protein [Desulfobacteraceae bacterium]|nr:MAG: amino acid ABC transporter ATP-binding protein [Desulfobacteraceae bacterium]